MELKSRSFTSKEPQMAREPQVADPWPRWISELLALFGKRTTQYTLLITWWQWCDLAIS